MGANVLNKKLKNGDVFKASDVNQYQDALNDDLVPRESGRPASGKNLGNPVYPWGTVHGDNLHIGGQVLNTSILSSGKYAIISGQKITGSDMAGLLHVSSSGVNANLTVRASQTPLKVIINGTSHTFNNDISVTVLPGMLEANLHNKYLGINIANARTSSGIINPFHGYFGSQYIRQNAGNQDVVYRDGAGNIQQGRIPVAFAQIDSAVQQIGEIYDNTRKDIFRRGRYHAFSFDGGRGNRECFIARPAVFENSDGMFSNLFLTDIRRRWLIGTGDVATDSHNIFGVPAVSRITVPTTDFNDKGFLIHHINWVFIKTDGTLFITNTEPVYAPSESEANKIIDNQSNYGIAWFNTTNELWYLKEFATNNPYEQQDMIPIGMFVLCADQWYQRSFHFSKYYNEENTIRIERREEDKFHVLDAENKVNVYGNRLEIKQNPAFNFDESTISTGNPFFFYLNTKGDPLVDLTAPIYFPELKGYYHPTKSWRCVGHHVRLNTPVAISWKYSNKEQYRLEYSVIISLAGTASRGNDASVTGGKDRITFGRIIVPYRPARNTADYHILEFLMNRNNLIDFNNLSENITGRVGSQGVTGLNRPLWVRVDPWQSGDKLGLAISYFRITTRPLGTFSGRSIDDQYLQKSNIPSTASGQFEVNFTLNDLELAEKELWNRLSSL